MEYVGRIPSPPLDQFVERIWYCADPVQHTRERVLPGGGALDLAINLVEDEVRLYDAQGSGTARVRSGAVVIGARTKSHFIDPRQRASVIGVHFRPGGAFPLLGISPSEIVDSHVPLDDLWGSDSRSLREQLLELRSTSARLALVEATLSKRLRGARAGHPAVKPAVHTLRAGGRMRRVAEVADLVGLSHRRFVEVFEREVGLTPKLYARLERFDHVKRRLAGLGPPPSWATFALECGYFDQSHLIRDFVELAGMSPTGYVRAEGGEAPFDHLVHAYRPG